MIKMDSIKGLIVKGLIALLLCSWLSLPGIQNSTRYGDQNTVGMSLVFAAAPQTAEEMCKKENRKPTIEDPDSQKKFSDAIKFIVAGEKMLLALNMPIVMMIGKLISNDWVYLDGSVSGALNNLWIVVRNFVNIIFVLALIFIAFMAVAGSGNSEKSKYEIKSMLPKVAIALIAVNFSFLFCKLILDMGNLATTASFSLVNEVGESVLGPKAADWEQKVTCWKVDNSKPMEGENKKCIPSTFYMGIGSVGVEQMCKPENIGNFDQDNTKILDSMGFAFGKDPIPNVSAALFNARNAMFIYSYNIFHIAEITDIYNKVNPNTSPDSIQGILITVLTSILYGAFLLLLNVAMLIAFAVRAIMIWMLIIFSPIMALEIVFKDQIKGKLPMMKDGFLHTFTSLAFMPALTGFVLSLCFLMYHVLMETDFAKANGDFKFGGFTIKIFGSFLPGFGTAAQLAITIMIMIILWMSIFSIFEKSGELVKTAVGGVKKFGEQIKSTAVKGISLIPIVPTPAGMASPAALSRTMESVGSAMTQMGQKDAEAFQKKSGLDGFLQGELKIPPDQITQMTNLANTAARDGKMNKIQLKEMVETVQHWGYDRPQGREHIAKMAQHSGIPELVSIAQSIRDGVATPEQVYAGMKKAGVEAGIGEISSTSITRNGSGSTAPAASGSTLTMPVGTVTGQTTALNVTLTPEIKTALTTVATTEQKTAAKKAAGEVIPAGQTQVLNHINSLIDAGNVEELKKWIKDAPSS